MDESTGTAVANGALSATGPERVRGWLADAGQALPAYLGPHTGAGRLAVVMTGSGNVQDLALTIAALLASSFQDFRVTLPAGSLQRAGELAAWLAGDERFVDTDGSQSDWVSREAVLILPVGVLLTKYSLEALFEALHQPGTSVVRAVVPGQPQALDFLERSVPG